MPKTICIITPGIIASNPRVVKEAEALSGAGYRVHLIYTRHVNYLVESDDAILKAHPEWKAEYLDWSVPGFRSKAIKYFSGMKKRLAEFIQKTNLYPVQLAPFLINRFYFWQLNKAIACKADLYIAHYPDCLGIAYKAAKVNKAFFAYDAEDYHRGEYLPEFVLRIIQEIEDSVLPHANYISAASPLIAEEYRKLFPNVAVVNIENMFAGKNQPDFQKITDDVIKFFWFSQTIGPFRGLEEFISILGQTNKRNVSLSLLGNVSETYSQELNNCWAKAGLTPGLLVFIETVPEKEIFKIAGYHHFGLCLEIPIVLNRDICITNKLYTYILSGNFLILSNTRAQKNFHTSNPQTGICFDLKNTKQAVEMLHEVLNNPAAINKAREFNYILGQSKLNFDQEKQILIKQVNSLWD